MRQFLCGLAVLATAVLSFAAPAWASAPQVDQSYLGAGTFTDTVSSNESFSQGFTVGLPGTLTDVELRLSASGTPNTPLTVQITRLNAGLPDQGQVVGTGTVQPGDVGASAAEVTVHLTVAPAVAPGDQYAIVLSTTSNPGGYIWWDNNSNGYAGGVAAVDTGGGWASTAYDKYFATYVTAAGADHAARAGYCSVAGDTWLDGSPIEPGTFLNLDDGQPSTDWHYTGATPALDVQGLGLTCDPPPAGYGEQGFVGAYPFYAP